MKWKVFLLIAPAFLITACQKETTIVEPRPHFELTPGIRSFISANDISLKRQLFQLLSPGERWMIWTKHLDAFMEKFSHVEEAKRQKIGELSRMLSPKVFEDNSREKDVFINYSFPKWMHHAKERMTTTELILLAYHDPSIFLGQGAKYAREPVPATKSKTAEGGSVPDCFCHVGTHGFSCTKFVYGTSGVNATHGICEQGSARCNYSSWGCGPLWALSCDGNTCNW